MGPKQPRVLIVDDHRLFADLITPPLEERGHTVIGLATTGPSALATVRHERPELVLLDLSLGGEDGISIGRRILSDFPDTKLIAVTTYTDCEAVRNAAEAGFKACVTKDTPLNHFVATIQGVLDGQTVVSLPASSRVGRGSMTRVRGGVQSSSVELLTPREYEVLMLLAEGANSSEMAERLVLSPNTIRTHVQSVLTKLHVHSRIEAAATAVRLGLVNTHRAQVRDSNGFHTSGVGRLPLASRVVGGRRN